VPPPRKRPASRRPLRRPRIGALLPLAVATLGLLVAGYAWASTRGLPAFDTLKDYQPLIATRVYAVDGSEAFDFYRERRTVVAFDQIPDVVKKAVLAAEDARFYEHEGVNYLAIARCALKNLARGHTYCGGSTITQQVVKTFLLSSEKRFTRKLKEVVLARRLEQNLHKDEILYLYLNQIYFGHRRYGVEEASRFYFGKPVQRLTVGEAATIAGLVQSPERLSPVKHPEAAKERQKYVLRRMAEEGFISQRVAESEMARPIQVASHPVDPPGAWYADAVRKYLDERYGAERVETEGLVVDIAMDPVLQRLAEDSLEAQLRAVDKRQGWRGPITHLDAKQVSAALPTWRERLKAVQGRPGEFMVWDLGRVSRDELEPGTDPRADVRRRVGVRPLVASGTYAALVTSVTDRSATVDLGSVTASLGLADVAWARKYNPVAATPAPRRMRDVVQQGDVVLVRALTVKGGPAELARAGKQVPVALEQAPRVQGALVAVDPATRGVRALVGGYDFATSQFNRAIQARRQPGSAFKPFVWGAAVESRRYTPATLVYDTPEVYRDPWTGKEWKPQNFERDEYDGPLLLREALAHSKNTVAVKLVGALGVDAVADVARRCGIESDLPRTLSLALGVGEVTPLELVNAYTTIAAQGHVAEPVLVMRVRDRKGQVLEEHRGEPATAAAPAAPAPVPVPVVVPAATTSADHAPRGEGATTAAPAVHAPPASGLEPEVAYVLTSMMQAVIDHGTGGAARQLGRPLAGKTGTAQDHRDAWFVGFAPTLSAGVWIGFDSHEPLGPHETGAGAALPAWMSFMREALAGRPAAEFAMPPNVDLARIDPATGLLADPATADAPTLPFVSGTAPQHSASHPPPGSEPQNFFMDLQ
jgi:penicillin-binding protein 1A